MNIPVLEREITLWECGIKFGIRRGFVMFTWNKNRNRGINVSLSGIEGGIKRHIMWNKL